MIIIKYFSFGKFLGHKFLLLAVKPFGHNSFFSSGMQQADTSRETEPSSPPPLSDGEDEVASKDVLHEITEALAKRHERDEKEMSKAFHDVTDDADEERALEKITLALAAASEEEKKNVVEAIRGALEVVDPIGTVIDTERAVQHSIVSGDGKILVALHCNGPDVEIYDVTTKKLLHTMHERFDFVAFTNPVSHTFVGRNERGYWLIDADSGEEKRRIVDQPSKFFDQSTMSDGKRLAICLEDSPDHLLAWNLETGEVESVSYGDPKTGDEVNTAAISPTGNFAVVSRDLANTEIVSVNRYKVVLDNTCNPLFIHRVATKLQVSVHVASLKYSSDGNYVLATTFDAGASVFDATTGRELYRIDELRERGDAVFTPDNQHLVACEGRHIFVCDAATGKVMRRRELDSACSHVTLAPAGQFATCTFGNTKICVFSI